MYSLFLNKDYYVDFYLLRRVSHFVWQYLCMDRHSYSGSECSIWFLWKSHAYFKKTKIYENFKLLKIIINEFYSFEKCLQQILTLRSVCSVLLFSLKLDLVNQVQILDVATSVLFMRISLGKVCINFFSMQIGLFSLGKATSLGEGKLWIQTTCK